MYKKCLTCQKMGVSCDGPNFMAMSTDALVEWCIQRRKQMPGMTYDKIAEATGLSKGTVSGFFNKTHSDYRLETIRPILKILVGGDWDDNPCDDPAEHERAKYEAEISRRDETIARLEKTNASLEMLVTTTVLTVDYQKTDDVKVAVPLYSYRDHGNGRVQFRCPSDAEPSASAGWTCRSGEYRLPP